MGLLGFEPATSPLSGVRSNQLSYRPTQPTPILRVEERRSTNCGGNLFPALGWKSVFAARIDVKHR